MKWTLVLVAACLLDISSTEASVKCAACTFLVGAIKWRPTDTAYYKVGGLLCRLFAYDGDVCTGIQLRFESTFRYVWPQLSARQVCALWMDECDSAATGANWTIPLPPPPPPSPPPSPLPLSDTAPKIETRKRDVAAGEGSSSPRLIRIVQLSDPHIDWDYEEGAEVECSLPQCCRSRGTTNGSVTRAAGKWGIASRRCDIPYRTFVHALRHIANQHRRVDAILLTGDYVNHASWEHTKPALIRALRNISATVARHLPNVPVHWVLGNHDTEPVNGFAPKWAPQALRPHHWLYEEFAHIVHGITTTDATDDILAHGSYATFIRPKLQLISLNNGYCVRTNFVVRLNQTDPDGVLQWLVDKLTLAEQNGHRAILAVHVPPGNPECLEGWAQNYYRITQRFHRTIVTHLFGHVHRDLFTLFYEDMQSSRSRPISVGFVAPSLTTYGNVNPGYRVLELDGDDEQADYAIYDSHSFSASLPSFEEVDAEPRWRRRSSMRSSYRLRKRLTPLAMHAFAERIVHKTRLQRRFVQNAFRSSFRCEGSCLRDLLCSIFAAHRSRTLCPLIAQK